MLMKEFAVSMEISKDGRLVVVNSHYRIIVSVEYIPGIYAIGQELLTGTRDDMIFHILPRPIFFMIELT